MSGHEAYRGVRVDHLYRDCPSLKRAKGTDLWPTGHRTSDEVDPLGTDICGLCRRRYEREVSDE